MIPHTFAPIASLSEAERAAVRDLPGILLGEGYHDIYTSFGVLHLRFADVKVHLPLMAPRTRVLIETFFLGAATPRAALAPILGEARCDALASAGLLAVDGDRLSTRAVIASMFGRMLLIPLNVADRPVYFGSDSSTLAVRVLPRRGARCLDMCCGSGLLAVQATTAGGRVVAVDQDERAVIWTGWNALLNSLEELVEVRQGNLYDALGPDERFDHVVANPPTAPVPPGFGVSHVLNGGADAGAVLRPVVAGLPKVLAPGGQAQIVGASLGDDQGPHILGFLREVSESAGARISVTLTNRFPLQRGSGAYDGLVAACARSSPLSSIEVEKRVAAHFRAQNATQHYLFLLAVTLGGEPEVTVSPLCDRPSSVPFHR